MAEYLAYIQKVIGSSPISRTIYADMMKLADTLDSKSSSKECGFKSHYRYQICKKRSEKMISPTHGEISLRQAATLIKNFIELNPDEQYAIYVGSDSQNTYYTKMVTVIAVHRLGHGGQYFYEISKYDKIRDIRKKLYTETQLSLDMAERLLKEFHDIDFNYDADNIAFCIHIDCGVNGPSGAVIPEVVGYVHSMGYECQVKPDSPIASCIADRISK